MLPFDVIITLDFKAIWYSCTAILFLFHVYIVTISQLVIEI